MALADSLKSLARSVRAIPGQMGLRPHRVFLVTETWDGGQVGEGTKASVEVELVEGDNQPPKVRQLTDERRALGDLAAGALEIGPVTPPDAGTITADMLRGVDLQPGIETLKLRVSGPLGDALYTIKGLTMDRAIHWTIVAEPTQTTT